MDTSGLSLNNPRLVYAAVPVQFFEEEKGSGMDRSHPATWPILAAFRDSEHSNQCALYAMKGGHIERIHHYQGSRYARRASLIDSLLLICVVILSTF